MSAGPGRRVQGGCVIMPVFLQRRNGPPIPPLTQVLLRLEPRHFKPGFAQYRGELIRRILLEDPGIRMRDFVQ